MSLSIRRLTIALTCCLGIPAAFAVTYVGSDNQITPVLHFLNGSTVAIPTTVTQPLPIGAAKLAYSASTSATVATSSGTLFAAATYSRVVKLCTKLTDTATVWLSLTGGTAAANSGLPIWGGGQCRTLGTVETPMPSSAVTAITDGVSSQTLLVSGG
jgi:hypothetical protein